MRHINIIIGIMLGGFALFNQSCTQYDTPPAIAVDLVKDDSSAIVRKVLWINIDGAVGQIVGENIPPRMAEILPHSKYAWNGLSENRKLNSANGEEDPVTWSTMLTGVNLEKHHIEDATYTPNFNLDFDDQQQKVPNYPNIMFRISEADPAKTSICITPWHKLNSNMLNNANKTITTDNDEETKNEVVISLANDDHALTLISFKGMLEAGKAGGFLASNTGYLSALNTIDGYIGECLTAIQARKNYANEDWLVVITSNHGGKAKEYAGNSDEERNIFGIFYYPHYTEQHMQGETFIAAMFNKDIKAYTHDSILYFNMDERKAMSLEMIIRNSPRENGSYDGHNWDRIIGKDKWGIYRQRTETETRFTDAKGHAFESGIANTLNDVWWHAYSVGIKPDSRTTDRTVSIFYDGTGKYQSYPTKVTGVIRDSSDLTIGGYDIATNYYIAEVRFWKNFLSDGEFVEYSSKVNMPVVPEMLSYWKFNPEYIVEDTIVKNQVAGMPDLRLTAPPTFVKFANTLAKYRSTGNLIIENNLIAPQILYWLKINDNLPLDGVQFLNIYTAEEESWREDV